MPHLPALSHLDIARDTLVLLVVRHPHHVMEGKLITPRELNVVISLEVAVVDLLEVLGARHLGRAFLGARESLNPVARGAASPA